MKSIVNQDIKKKKIFSASSTSVLQVLFVLGIGQEVSKKKLTATNDWVRTLSRITKE